MKDLIKLRSRGGAENYLKKLIKKDGSESLTYVLKTDTPYLRGGEVSNGNKFIDPSGGPMIVAGDYNDRYFNGGMELAVWAGTEHNSTSIQTARPYIQGSVSEVYYRDAWIT